MKGHLFVIFISIFLMNNDVKHLFMCLLSISTHSLETCLFRSCYKIKCLIFKNPRSMFHVPQICDANYLALWGLVNCPITHNRSGAETDSSTHMGLSATFCSSKLLIAAHLTVVGCRYHRLWTQADLGYLSIIPLPTLCP